MPLITDRCVERVRLLEDEPAGGRKQPSAYLKQKFKNTIEEDTETDSSLEESPLTQAKKRKSISKITELTQKKGDSGTQITPGPLDFQRINSIKEVDEGSECSTINIKSRNRKLPVHKTYQPRV
mmetsp:Transcript_18491/g.28380  ORF Transcript_18491/g.28380 Transcript_18491/m.28380 type:complete len:124 (-) Transcript_18491:2399-2770(-)